MEQTFTDMYAKLKDTREYAQIRIGAFVQLKKIVNTEGYRHPNFMPNLYRVQDVICLQVIQRKKDLTIKFKELNSQVLKEACEVLG